jgi:hypothetical protein
MKAMYPPITLRVFLEKIKFFNEYEKDNDNNKEFTLCGMMDILINLHDKYPGKEIKLVFSKTVENSRDTIEEGKKTFLWNGMFVWDYSSCYMDVVEIIRESDEDYKERLFEIAEKKFTTTKLEFEAAREVSKIKKIKFESEKLIYEQFLKDLNGIKDEEGEENVYLKTRN